ncbi:putative Retrovirus-related Pol polyprotein from transposon opus [Paratrimastix pyriformis]|uniref:Retrovirus-related Pol polyprotein from transposon opus n=1 Tax=Paratrimastix pyriformis TaxID=342808 RepID=A0ABQ8U6N9_9EUKA|nr:putative Retrovirus-related Pol polyprotein from transposon opus [Paratrimastix pyriformis]
MLIDILSNEIHPSDSPPPLLQGPAVGESPTLSLLPACSSYHRRLLPAGFSGLSIPPQSCHIQCPRLPHWPTVHEAPVSPISAPLSPSRRATFTWPPVSAAPEVTRAGPGSPMPSSFAGALGWAADEPTSPSRPGVLAVDGFPDYQQSLDNPARDTLVFVMIEVANPASSASWSRYGTIFLGISPMGPDGAPIVHCDARSSREGRPRPAPEPVRLLVFGPAGLAAPISVRVQQLLQRHPQHPIPLVRLLLVLLDSIASPRPRPAPVLPEFAQAAVGSSPRFSSRTDARAGVRAYEGFTGDRSRPAPSAPVNPYWLRSRQGSAHVRSLHTAGLGETTSWGTVARDFSTRVSVNSVLADALIDTGASTSVVFRATTEELGLPVRSLPTPVRVFLANGSTSLARHSTEFDLQITPTSPTTHVDALVFEGFGRVILGRDSLQGHFALLAAEPKIVPYLATPHPAYNQDHAARPPTCRAASVHLSPPPPVGPLPPPLTPEELAAIQLPKLSDPSAFDEQQRAQLLERHRLAFSPLNSVPARVAPFDLTLLPGSIPRSSQPRRANPATQAIINAEIDRLHRLGIVQPTDSLWSFPLVVVGKRGGGARVCVDFTRLNELTVKHTYPIPDIRTLTTTLRNSRFFSSLDLTSGFLQLPSSATTTPLLTLTSAAGNFSFTRLPFGISSGPEIFQRTMSRLLGDVGGTTCYQDDVNIHGETFEAFLQRLDTVLGRIELYNLHANALKCNIGGRQARYLGLIVDGDTVRPDPERLAAIAGLRPPTSKKELQQFLGTVNYWAAFLPAAQQHISLLWDTATAVPFAWGSKEQAAWDHLRHSLLHAVPLFHPDPDWVTVLRTDASQLGLGAWLLQLPPGSNPLDPPNSPPHTLGFAARKLSPAEQRHSTIELELEAIIMGLHRFRSILPGHITAITDHHNLSFRLSSPTPRLSRLLIQLAEYPVTIVYSPGKTNTVADMLSRLTNTPAPPPASPAVSGPHAPTPPVTPPPSPSPTRLPLPTPPVQVSVLTRAAAAAAKPATAKPATAKPPPSPAAGLAAAAQQRRGGGGWRWRAAAWQRRAWRRRALRWRAWRRRAWRWRARCCPEPATSAVVPPAVPVPAPAPAPAALPAPVKPPAPSVSSAPAAPPLPSAPPAPSTPPPTPAFARPAAPATTPPPICTTSPTPPTRPRPPLLPTPSATPPAWTPLLPTPPTPTVSPPAVTTAPSPAVLGHHAMPDTPDEQLLTGLPPPVFPPPDAPMDLPAEIRRLPHTTTASGVISLHNRPPDPLVATLVALAHSGWPEGHFGRDRTAFLLHQSVTWPNSLEDVSRFVAHCPACQLSRGQPAPAPDLLTVPPALPLATVVLDFIGPLTESQGGNKYLLVMVDRCTRYTVLAPIPTLDALTVCTAVVDRWIAFHGVPSLFLSDGGPPFNGGVYEEFVRLLGAQLHISLPLAPMGHGLVERANETAVNTLRAVLTAHHSTDNWDSVVPQLQLAVNSVPNRCTGFPPFTLLHSFPARLPMHHALHTPLPKPRSADHLEAATLAHQTLLECLNLVFYHDKREAAKRREAHLKRVKDKAPSYARLQSAWLGPYAVVGPGANASSRVLRDLVTGDEFLAAVARMRPFLPGSLTKDELRLLATPPGQFFVQEVLSHRGPPLEFLIQWEHTPFPTWARYEDCAGNGRVSAYMKEHGVRRPALAKRCYSVLCFWHACSEWQLAAATPRFGAGARGLCVDFLPPSLPRDFPASFVGSLINCLQSPEAWDCIQSYDRSKARTQAASRGLRPAQLAARDAVTGSLPRKSAQWGHRTGRRTPVHRLTIHRLLPGMLAALELPVRGPHAALARGARLMALGARKGLTERAARGWSKKAALEANPRCSDEAIQSPPPPGWTVCCYRCSSFAKEDGGMRATSGTADCPVGLGELSRYCCADFASVNPGCAASHAGTAPLLE